MAVTVYSLGDHEMIRAGLTAVAMLFDSGNTDLFTGVGLAGLGHAAAFGLLVSVGWIAMKVIVGQPFTPGHLLAVLLAYVIMFVPKITMQIEDIYSGQVAIVDDVPLGVALPGGVISGVARSITIKLDQALRSADAETSTLSENGMVSPLKLMLAARGAALIDEGLTLSLSRYIAECTEGIPPNAASSAASPFFFLQNPFPNFITAIYQSGTTPSSTDQWSHPEFVSCTSAAFTLETKIRELISKPEFDEYLTQRMGVNRPNATMGGRWTANDLQVYINNFARAGTDAQNVMAQLATSDIIADTYRCGALDTRDAINCSAAMRSAVEGAKYDSAGRGSVFARTMIPSMNVFMFLFFAVSPLIAVVIAVSGMHGVTKVMPNYLLFGVWTQSWLPMAAIINHFILRQSKDAADRGLINSDGLPLRSGVEFYDLLSTKIAAASDLLASTPIVTFAIISGSVMGLAQLASKAGDSFSEKNVAPDVSKVDATSGTQSRSIEAPRFTNAGMTINDGQVGASPSSSSDKLNIGISSDSIRSMAAGEQVAAEASAARSQQLSQQLYQGMGAKVAGSMQKSSGSFGQADFTQLHGQSRQFADQINNAIRSSNTESTLKSIGLDSGKLTNVATAALLDAAKNGADAKGQKFAVAKSIDGVVRQAAKNMGGLAPSASLVDAAQKSIENAIGQSFGSTATEMNDWSAKMSSGQRSSAENAFLNEVSKSLDKKLGETLAQTNAETRKRTNSAQQLDSFAKGLKSGTSMNGGELASLAANGSGILAERLGDLRKANGFSEQEAVALANKYTGNKYPMTGDPAVDSKNRQLAAAYGTALKFHLSHPNEIASAAYAEIGNTNAVGSIKSEQQVGAAVSEQGKGAPTGMAPGTQQRIAGMVPQAQQAAANAEGRLGSVDQELASAQGAASQTVSQATFNQYAGQVDSAAAASGVGAANNQRAISGQAGEAFAAKASALQQQFGENGSMMALAKRFGSNVANDPVIGTIAALAGGAAAAATIQDINSHYGTRNGGGSSGPTTGGQPGGGGGPGQPRGGNGGGAPTRGEFTQRVFSNLADKLPTVLAGAAATHASASAAGAAGLGPGVALANTIAVGADLISLGSAIHEAIEMTEQQYAAEGRSQRSTGNGSPQSGSGAQTGGGGGEQPRRGRK